MALVSATNTKPLLGSCSATLPYWSPPSLPGPGPVDPISSFCQGVESDRFNTVGRIRIVRRDSRLLVGYFEGIDSERGIVWRAVDSMGLRKFLGVGLDEQTSDHSTISRTRRLIDVETHRKVFFWILELLRDQGLLKGKTVGIDATTLEANAAMRSKVRRDSGESYEEFLKGLTKKSGVETPTREDLARFDRKRKNKTCNKDWVNPHDRDARNTKMKDDRTHLAHKAEHAVDLESGAVLAVTLQEADQGDTTTVVESLAQAGENAAGLLESETTNRKPQMHVRGIEGSAALGRQARAAASGLCQPAAGEWSVWKAPVTEERRADRTELCALPRHRKNETHASARA
jgi:hypothetical protein